MTTIDSIDARTGAPTGRTFDAATNDDVDNAALDAHRAADTLAAAGRVGRAAFLRAAAEPGGRILAEHGRRGDQDLVSRALPRRLIHRSAPPPPF